MGGRGAGSGSKIINTGGGGLSNPKTKYMDPGKLQQEMKQKSQYDGIKTFIDKHANENHEFIAVVNSKGTVMQYNEGEKTAVGARFRDNNNRYFQADMGSVDIHNHPSGAALPSTADLQSWASTKEISTSYIIGKKTKGMKSNHLTSMTKTASFNEQKFNSFIKMVQNKNFVASEYAQLLKSNSGKYGYKFNSTYIK